MRAKREREIACKEALGAAGKARSLGFERKALKRKSTSAYLLSQVISPTTPGFFFLLTTSKFLTRPRGSKAQRTRRGWGQRTRDGALVLCVM